MDGTFDALNNQRGISICAGLSSPNVFDFISETTQNPAQGPT